MTKRKKKELSEFGKHIEGIVLQTGNTVAWLSVKIGVSVGTAYSILQRDPPRYEHVMKIVKLFELDKEEMLSLAGIE